MFTAVLLVVVFAVLAVNLCCLKMSCKALYYIFTSRFS